MFQKLYPSVYVESPYEIDYESLYADGYRGLLYDIDNTLVTYGAPATPRAVELFARLHAIGFSCCFISNNGEDRVKMFNEKIGAQYTFKAHKPSADGYLTAMELMGTTPENTIFIGDQIFTDVWGANRTDMPVILVRSIWWIEEFQVMLKRVPEVFVLLSYRHYRKKHKTTVPGAFFARGDQVKRYLFRGHARSEEDVRARNAEERKSQR